jgi:hypothetical protein
MKQYFILFAAGMLLGCRHQTWVPPESFILEDFQVYPGKHCESSAMMNLLRYQGFDITENQIIGAGSALGFVLDTSNFPFLGGRNLELRENFEKTTGILWHDEKASAAEEGWDSIFNLLRNGNPVVLRVDMRYLPYRYGGRYGSKYMSFGWHMICLAGINAEKQTAYVSDTEYPSLQEIKLSDLRKARFSDTKVFPPEGQYYWTEKSSHWNGSWEKIAEESLRTCKEAMNLVPSGDGSLIGLNGLSKFPATLASLDERVPSYLLGPLLAFHYGCIETNGTGGAAFRKMYHEFLETEGRKSDNPTLLEAASVLEPAVGAWSDLASEMKKLSEQKSVLKDKNQRKEALLILAEKAKILYQREKRFYETIRD